jgi:hypothetical protein
MVKENTLVKSSTLRASVILCTSLPFAACTGQQVQNNTIPAVAAPSHVRSWMRAEAVRSKILYVSYGYGNDVLAFQYPSGQALGVISGIPQAQGLCTSKKSHGNWWVVATGANEVLEFAHGGTTPILTINTMSDLPASCAVDPTTGNLAVTMASSPKVVVYKAGSIDGTAYVPPFYPFFSGYDPSGNLYVDGSAASNIYLARLRPGTSTFQPIFLNYVGVFFAGGIQWHKGLLAVGDQETAVVYQYKLRGKNGILRNTTALNGGQAGGFWIQGNRIIAGDGADVGIWDYPAGGSPVQTIPGGFYGPVNAAVSLPK